MPNYPDEIEYSEKYADDLYEYRHVFLPKAIAKEMFKITGCKRLLEDNEWRGLGVEQSCGWAHYEIFKREPHILLFRRPLGTDPHTGRAPEKILTVLFSWKGELVHVSCVSIAGEEAFSMDAPPTSGLTKVVDELSKTFNLAPERLKLLFPSGELLPWQNPFWSRMSLADLCVCPEGAETQMVEPASESIGVSVARVFRGCQ